MLLHLQLPAAQLRCCCWCWGALMAHQGLGNCLAVLGWNGRCLQTKQQLLHLLDFVQLCLLHPCCCLQMLGLCKEGTVMTVTSKGPAMQRSWKPTHWGGDCAIARCITV